MARWYFGFMVAVLCLVGCHRGKRQTYAIRDFEPALQPCLTAAVSTGLVGDDSASRFIRDHATEAELRRLTCSEHPTGLARD